jgi:hypothetical protein
VGAKRLWLLVGARTGRKVTLSATVTDGADKTFADGEALFVQPRSSNSSKL